MNAIQLISSALRLVGVLAAGEQVENDDAADSLVVLQQMIDAWNADRLAIFTTRIDDFPFVNAQQSYTLGTGGDFNIPRPARIDGISSVQVDNPNNPVEIPIEMYTVVQWQTQVPVKKVDGNIPLICYDSGDYPLRVLNFWPIPQTQPVVCRIYSWQALDIPATYTTVINFPPGYAEAFRYNLALRLHAEFNADQQLSPLVSSIAVESLARVKSMNAPDLLLRSDLVPDPSGYNYRADMFGMGW